MNAFLVASLLLDRRPPIRGHSGGRLPGITVLVAAYNEQANVAATVESLARQDYPGRLQVIVIDDGSTDRTAEVLAGIRHAVAAGGEPRAQRRQVQRAERRPRPGASCAHHHGRRRLVPLPRRAAQPGRTLPRRPAGHRPWPARCWCATRARTWSPRSRSGTTSTASPRSSGCRASTRARSSRRARSRSTDRDAAQRRRLGRTRGRGHRAHLGAARAGPARRLRRGCRALHQRAGKLAAVHPPAPALVARHDRGLQGASGACCSSRG